MSSFFPLSPPAHSFFIGPIVINIYIFVLGMVFCFVLVMDFCTSPDTCDRRRREATNPSRASFHPLPVTPDKNFSKPSKYGRPSVDGHSRKFLSKEPRAGPGREPEGPRPRPRRERERERERERDLLGNNVHDGRPGRSPVTGLAYPMWAGLAAGSD